MNEYNKRKSKKRRNLGSKDLTPCLIVNGVVGDASTFFLILKFKPHIAVVLPFLPTQNATIDCDISLCIIHNTLYKNINYLPNL